MPGDRMHSAVPAKCRVDLSALRLLDNQSVVALYGIVMNGLWTGNSWLNAQVMQRLYFRSMNYIIAIGIFQAMIAFALIGHSKLRTQSDGLLLLLLLCIGTHLSIKFIIYTLVKDVEVRSQMNTFIGFCYGPLILLYAHKVFDVGFVTVRKWYLFLPFLAGMIGYLTVASVLFLAPEIGHAVLKMYNSATTVLLPLFTGVCAYLALRVSTRLAPEQKKETQLIRKLAISLAIVSLISIVYGIVRIFLNVQIDPIVRSICYFLFGWMCVIILRFKYAGVSVREEPAVTFDTDVTDQTTIAEVTIIVDGVVEGADHVPSESIRKLHLKPEEHQVIFEKLEAYLERTSAYSDVELTLDKLATAVQVSRYHLSETLNIYAGKSFYQYINEWRINRVVEQMGQLAEKEIPINFLILAYDNGFKAKSSFNLYFKKMTGHTPTSYLKMLSDPSVFA